MQFTIHPGGPLRGIADIPGDKSISHRAVMLGALAAGTTTVRDCLVGEDVLSTIGAMRALGVPIERDGTTVRIEGTGGRFTPDPVRLDVGNSGTSMRLMTGLLAGRGVAAELVGDASLMKRPMERVAAPLRDMGADVVCLGESGRPPVRITPAPALTPLDYAMPVASAQVKSALMLAALTARGTTRIVQPAPTRDHTERMLSAFGADVNVTELAVSVTGPCELTATDVVVPGDVSSAAFFLVAASIVPGSRLVLKGVGMNPTRTGVIEILEAMGARIGITQERTSGGEPVADLEVEAASLTGIEIPPHTVPNAIDEFPVLFVAAAAARGRTVLKGAEELRYKESDRIATMAEGLTALGVMTEVFDDGIAITGGQLGAGQVAAHGDHRIAMSFAVAGAVAQGPVRITDCAAVATSFPGFPALARALGLDIRIEGGT